MKAPPKSTRARRRASGASLPLPRPLAVVFSALASGATLGVLLGGAALLAFVGLVAAPGEHPLEGPLGALLAAALPFCLAAAAVERGNVLELLLALGAGLVGLGAVIAGGQSGVASLGGPALAESMRSGPRGVPVHLGGQLTVHAASADDPGLLSLSLGVGAQRAGEAAVRVGEAREAVLGPWAVHAARMEPGEAPTTAVVRVRPRSGEHVPGEVRSEGGESEGAPMEGSVARVRLGGQVAIGPLRLTVHRLSADFGGVLGPAAQIAVEAPSAAETAWHFVDSPDLDARVGLTPWIIELLAVEAEPRMQLGMRRSGRHEWALLGWAVIALLLLVRAVRGGPSIGGGPRATPGASNTGQPT